MHCKYYYCSTLNFFAAPPVLEAFDTTVTAQINSSVTLSCEIYGYLADGAEPHISWQKLPSTAITSNDPLYIISDTNGSKQIQNGGSTPGPSFVSSLTIDVVDETVAGTYLCSSTATGATIPSIKLTVTGTCTLYVIHLTSLMIVLISIDISGN